VEVEDHRVDRGWSLVVEHRHSLNGPSSSTSNHPDLLNSEFTHEDVGGLRQHTTQR
jgi:hypothetical protein